MASYIVTTPENNEPIREAMGRLYAASLEEVWPIRSRFPNGDIDPDINHATFYYMDARPSASGTQVAFPVDATVTTFLGQTIATTYGEVTVPSETQVLDDSWFPEPER